MLTRPIRRCRKKRFRSYDSDSSSADRSSSPSFSKSDSNATTKKKRSKATSIVQIAPTTLAEEEEYKLVNELKTLSARLERNDPELRHVELLPCSRRCSSLLGSFWLENMFVFHALQECWHALRGNRHVRHLVLKALPAFEIAKALRNAKDLQDLQHIWIQQTLPSQSLLCDYSLCVVLLDAHMPIPSLQRTGLQSLCLDVRLGVTSQLDLDGFSLSLRLLTQLKNVQLYLMPRRRSRHNPTLSMQSLLQTFADLANNHQKLTTLQLTLGDAQYPIQQPMIQNDSVLELLLSSRSSLERLQLDNFGFRNEHLRVVTRALQTNIKLQDLHLAASGVFSVPAVQALCDVLQQRSNVTLQSCIVGVRSPSPSDGTLHPHQNEQRQQDHHNATELQWQQERLNMWCFLNRLRPETLRFVGGTPPRAPTHREWWDMIFRVDQSRKSRRIDAATAVAAIVAAAPGATTLQRRGRRNEQQQHRRQSPRTPPISVLLLGSDRDDDDDLPLPRPSEEEMARNRCVLGAIYTLVRSHPEHIVAAAAAMAQEVVA